MLKAKSKNEGWINPRDIQFHRSQKSEVGSQNVPGGPPALPGSGWRHPADMGEFERVRRPVRLPEVLGRVNRFAPRGF